MREREKSFWIVLGQERRAVQAVHVVAPAVGDVAAQTDDAAERGVPQIVVAAAAFDVAPADVHQHVARAGVAAAERVERGGREQRVVAVHGVATEERRLRPGRRRGTRRSVRSAPACDRP